MFSKNNPPVRCLLIDSLLARGCVSHALACHATCDICLTKLFSTLAKDVLRLLAAGGDAHHVQPRHHRVPLGRILRLKSRVGYLQGDPSRWLKPPVDSVPTVLALGGPLLQLPTAQAGWRNIPNPSQREVFTKQMCHPVVQILTHLTARERRCPRSWSP